MFYIGSAHFLWDILRDRFADLHLFQSANLLGHLLADGFANRDIMGCAVGVWNLLGYLLAFFFSVGFTLFLSPAINIEINYYYFQEQNMVLIG